MINTEKKHASKRIKQNGYIYAYKKSSFEKKLFIQTAYITNVYIKKRVSFADITASFKLPKNRGGHIEIFCGMLLWQNLVIKRFCFFLA